MKKNNGKEEIELIKREISLYDLAVKEGCRLKKLGSGEYVTNCIFPGHNDKTPSLHINTQKNVFDCKGCDKCGSPIDWVMGKQNVDTGNAIKICKEMVPSLFEPKNGKEFKGASAPTSPNTKAEAVVRPIRQAQAKLSSPQVEITEIKYQQLLKRSIE